MRPCSVGHETVQRGQEKYIFHLLNIFLQEKLIVFLVELNDISFLTIDYADYGICSVFLYNDDRVSVELSASVPKDLRGAQICQQSPQPLLSFKQSTFKPLTAKNPLHTHLNYD